MLRLIYIVGWLPALLAAQASPPAAGRNHVLHAAGAAGIAASIGLAASLSLLSAAYAYALWRPPTQRELSVACLGSVCAALILPQLFSADVYAYAYYGDLALHGTNPYGHTPGILVDPLAGAATAAWDGHIPPRCVYGPLAVGLAALADLAGLAGGATTQIDAQRLTAAIAYGLCLIFVLRLLRDPRARVALFLNPVVLWSVAEGHNDAAMLALILGGLASSDRRAVLLGLAACVKAPAFLALAVVRARGKAVTLALSAAAYIPLALAVASVRATMGANRTADPAAWQSPLGLLAAGIGRGPALAAAAVCLGGVILAAQRLRRADRLPAVALAAWYALPNAYPWYALWIVPLAAGNIASRWSQALLMASLCAAVRVGSDVIYPSASTFGGADTFYGQMIALEYLPPLAFAVLRNLRRPIATMAVAIMMACTLPCAAQTVGPNPQPAPSPAAAASTPPPSAAPAPATAGSTSPNPPASALTPTPQPPSQPSAPAAVLVPTPNPFTYIITPTATPVTAPDGPHIVEVDVNERQIRAGGQVIVRVLTSSNVIGVEARALGRFIAIPQTAAGVFSLAYNLPGGIPFWFLNKNYDIVIAAATPDGRQTSVCVPALTHPLTANKNPGLANQTPGFRLKLGFSLTKHGFRAHRFS